MELTVYKDTNEFLDDNKDLLESKALELNMFWKNIQSGKTSRDGLFAAKVSHNDEILLATRVEPYPMVLYSKGNDQEQLVDELIKHLSQDYSFPKNINSWSEAVSAFAERCNRYGVHYKQKRLLDMMLCDKVSDIETGNYDFKYIREVDKDLTEYFFDYRKECRMDITKDGAKQIAERYKKANICLCLIVDEEVVSIAVHNISLEIINAFGISGVYTPKRFRNKGYSTACVKKLVEDSFSKGYDKAFLYAEDPAAIHVYEKIGFSKIGELKEYELE